MDTDTDPIRCDGCSNVIDKGVCWCGGLISEHGASTEHSPVPMGCTCYMGSKFAEDYIDFSRKELNKNDDTRTT